MRADDLRQRAEQRRRYLDGFAHHLLVCAGLGCQGNEEIVAELNRAVNERGLADRVLVRRTGCMGLCALGPLVRVEPAAIVYQGVRPGDADEIVTALALEPVARLLVPPDLPFFIRQRKRVLALCGRHAEALEAIGRSLRIEQTVENLYQAYRVHTLAGDADEARRTARYLHWRLHAVDTGLLEECAAILAEIRQVL